MTTLVPATAGFLPTHAYEGPDLERAKDICASINAFALEGMGLGVADPSKVRGLSLRQMLDAVDMVEAWNARPKAEGVSHSTCLVPAERLVSAVYTLLHHCDLRPLGDADHDDIVVRFTQKRLGDEFVHFLLIGNREKASIDEDQDD